MAIADYIFSEGLPLSTTSKDSFKLMVDTIRAAPLNYKLPSRAVVSSDILDRSYDQIKSKIDKLEDDAVTLQTDGWRDTQQRPLLNVLFRTVSKTFYYTSKETLGIPKTADYLVDFICSSIKELLKSGSQSLPRKPKTYISRLKTLLWENHFGKKLKLLTSLSLQRWNYLGLLTTWRMRMEEHWSQWENAITNRSNSRNITRI